MSDRQTLLPDAARAFLIGALTGVGVVLLLRSGDDLTDQIVQALREEGLHARKASPRLTRDLDRAVRLSRRIRERNGP